MAKLLTPVVAIRQKCLDCSESFKSVKYCPSDGIHSKECPLWLYRFGSRPASAAKKYGKKFVTPADMPEANTSLDDCGTENEAS